MDNLFKVKSYSQIKTAEPTPTFASYPENESISNGPILAVMGTCFAVLMALTVYAVFETAPRKRLFVIKGKPVRTSLTTKEIELLGKLRYFLKNNDYCWLKVVFDNRCYPIDYEEQDGWMNEHTGEIVPYAETRYTQAPQKSHPLSQFEELYRLNVKIPSSPEEKMLIQKLIYEDIDIDEFVDLYYGPEQKAIDLDLEIWTGMTSEEQNASIKSYFDSQTVVSLQALRSLINGFPGLRPESALFLQQKFVESKFSLLSMANGDHPLMSVCAILLIRDMIICQGDFELSVSVFLDFLLPLLRTPSKYTSVMQTTSKAVTMMVGALDLSSVFIIQSSAFEDILLNGCVSFQKLVLETIVVCLCRHKAERLAKQLISFVMPFLPKLREQPVLVDLLHSIPIAGTELSHPALKLIDDYKNLLMDYGENLGQGKPLLEDGYDNRNRILQPSNKPESR
ncbi:unnamed protein product [Kuraishia capsulata CBS 1993]|uniref:Uncharacterized protein n=1 Tax=Kuraishia capsulata CBS 1993 TaxID=1382522 RepID=W6MIQ5_9ASCO|nr:uncharacterized protein KUCA_T00001788001 [Kuraishia capsulata CBS 1993]CDK25818.1 unnamed protein product [Kuraishia capsulata CBS 1993]